MWEKKIDLGLVGLKTTGRMGNPLQVGARKCRELCFLCHVFKSFALAQGRSHSQPRVGVHALQFTTTLPEATATVAASASKAVCDLEKVLFQSKHFCYPLLCY